MSNNSSTVVDLTSNYQYIGFGSIAVLVNCIILMVLLSNWSFLKKSAFVAGLACGDLMDGMSLLVSGSVRIVRALNGTLNLTVHPFICISQSYTIVFLLGNQIPGVMFFLIGFERYLAVHYFDWYRAKWTHNTAWVVTFMAYIYIACSITVAVIVVFIQPEETNVTLSCGTPSVMGKVYSIYNYSVSVIGGTVAAVFTLASMIIFTKRHQRLKNNSNVSSQIKRFVKKQCRQTRAMLCLAILDLALVVIPNIMAMLVTGFQIKIPNVNLGGWSLQISCSRSFLNIFIYLSINNEFRSTTLKAFGFKNNGVLPMHATPTGPIPSKETRFQTTVMTTAAVATWNRSST